MAIEIATVGMNMVASVAIAIGAAVRAEPFGFAPSRPVEQRVALRHAQGDRITFDQARQQPFVVSLSNHERPVSKIGATGLDSVFRTMIHSNES